jgi:hypothetical protein
LQGERDVLVEKGGRKKKGGGEKGRGSILSALVDHGDDVSGSDGIQKGTPVFATPVHAWQ